MVFINERSFFIPADHFDFDAGFSFDVVYNGSGIPCITHGRSGTGDIMLHTIHIDQRTIGPDGFDDMFFFFWGDHLGVEYIKAQPEGHANQVKFIELVPAIFIGYDIGDQQPCCVTSYIYGG